MRQMTLIELVARLTTCSPKKTVQFDFGGMVPGKFASYRGFYEQIAIAAIHPDEVTKTVEAATLLKMASDAIGSPLPGYKGGVYRMGEDTGIWIAGWGEVTSTALVAVREYDHKIILETEYLDV